MQIALLSFFLRKNKHLIEIFFLTQVSLPFKGILPAFILFSESKGKQDYNFVTLHPFRDVPVKGHTFLNVFQKCDVGKDNSTKDHE